MTGRISQDKGPSNAGSETRSYKGEVVYIYTFDLAYDMMRERIDTLLGQPTRDYVIGQDKRVPKNLFFYRPQMVELPPQMREGPAGKIEIRCSIKVFNIGAISIRVRVPFEVSRIEDLVGYHNLNLSGRPLEDEIRELAERVRQELVPFCIRPVQCLGNSEDYTVFCIAALPAKAGESAVWAENWLSENRRQVAGLLTEEENPADLSDQESDESTSQYLSYYHSDLVVVDWDAAIIVGERDSLDNILHIMEVANVQLVELEAYDQILDASLETAYRDVARFEAHVSREVHRNLREIRVDLARMSDELLNITKFFGDWHLAEIYEDLSIRFHLSDWHGVMDEKLKTLGDLYQLLQQDRNNFLMVVLEATIILLFVIDLILLLLRF